MINWFQDFISLKFIDSLPHHKMQTTEETTGMTRFSSSAYYEFTTPVVCTIAYSEYQLGPNMMFATVVEKFRSGRGSTVLYRLGYHQSSVKTLFRSREVVFFSAVFSDLCKVLL